MRQSWKRITYHTHYIQTLAVCSALHKTISQITEHRWHCSEFTRHRGARNVTCSDYITRCHPCHRLAVREKSLRIPHCLQRVMDEYSGERPTSRGGRPLGTASPEGSTASQWESSEHIQTNISHLSSTLAGDNPHAVAEGELRPPEVLTCVLSTQADPAIRADGGDQMLKM